MRKRPQFLEEEREEFFRMARHYGDRAHAAQTDRPGFMKSGADAVDGERLRAVAKAFRRLGLGESLEIVVEEMKKEWVDFCTENNKKVEAAPKLRYGPSSGQSVISYKYAYPGRIDSDEIHVRSMYRTIRANARDNK